METTTTKTAKKAVAAARKTARAAWVSYQQGLGTPEVETLYKAVETTTYASNKAWYDYQTAVIADCGGPRIFGAGPQFQS